MPVSPVWVALQNLLADALIRLFTAINRRIDVAGAVARWYCGHEVTL